MILLLLSWLTTPGFLIHKSQHFYFSKWSLFIRYGVPRIAYINKLDKPAASISKTVNSIRKKLSVEPLLTQIALGGEGKGFFGVVDLVSMTAYKVKI